MLRQTSLLLKIEKDPYPNAYPDPDQGSVDYNACGSAESETSDEAVR